jgi:beta-glucanase (GH16 family)
MRTAPTARRTTFALVGALLLGIVASAAAAQSLVVPPGYHLVWADEFAAAGRPDSARWRADTSRNSEGWYNNEKQYYSGPAASNARVTAGRLLLTARRESPRTAADWGGQAYTSARIDTRGRAEWTYGFFEVRARVACGTGTWPAIWTLGSGGEWPADGELDIMEFVGHDSNQVSSAVHTTAENGGRSVHAAMPLARACRAFHRYQMLWTPDGVTFGVDGFAHLHYPRFERSTGAWPFDAPQYLVLNLAIGGDLGGAIDDRIFPTTMEIDYVRVYQPAH